jgi:uncharacterized protein (TIGR03382 family)
MMLVRKTNLTSEAILWAHEYGHNVGLNHNADSRYIMHGTNTGSNEALNATECDKFHNPHPLAQADMSVTGTCAPPVCDNGTCELGEDCNSCSADCISGTGFSCGNGVCEAGDGEDCVSCDLDCNGQQSGNPANRFCCGDGDGENPLPCSDPVCTSSGYLCTDVPNPPYCCGDLTCEGAETSLNCAVDCGEPGCGNGTCEFGEDCGNCPGDCISGVGSAVCGNGLCEAGDGEDCVSCEDDCFGLQSVPPPFLPFCCGDGDGVNPLPCSDPTCSSSHYQCTDVSAAVPFCCGDLTCEGDETPLNCEVDCGPPILTSWKFFGIAEGGGTIDLIISGVPLQVPTTEGESAAEVALAVAAAINNDPTLSSLGVTATSVGNQVTTSGSLDHISSTDAGITTYDVPALSGSGIALALLLLAGGFLFRRRRARGRRGR